jgi:hypothetical protein
MSFDPRLIAKMRGRKGIDEEMVADLIAYNATDQAGFNHVNQMEDEEELFVLYSHEVIAAVAAEVH